ncbi:MAG TPA: hypothetical protein VFQ85_13365 [Mycobacteriales bacterium]|jgi:hypothetical protein|nr:hypothetical protein [Mycobacteriales bacterium]
MKRTLTLRTERLAELTAADLGAVAGASGLPCEVQVELTKELCPSYGCTGYYPSIFDPCG